LTKNVPKWDGPRYSGGMKLAFSIAAAWALFDFLAGKAILGVIAPIDADLWQQIAHTVSVATR
ncbi:MAG TPA: hypothetical protein VID67_01665, partial [Rhizomicrobium sp.]